MSQKGKSITLEEVSVSIDANRCFFSDRLVLSFSFQAENEHTRILSCSCWLQPGKSKLDFPKLAGSAKDCTGFGFFFFFHLRFSLFTASPLNGNFKLLLRSRGVFCEDNVICLQRPRGRLWLLLILLPLIYIEREEGRGQKEHTVAVFILETEKQHRQRRIKGEYLSFSCWFLF